MGVSADKPKKAWLQAIEKHELEWINLRDESGNDADPFLIYGINGIPDNFLIDENGKIIGQNLRGEKLIATIEKEMVDQ